MTKAIVQGFLRPVLDWFHDSSWVYKSFLGQLAAVKRSFHKDYKNIKSKNHL